MSTKSPTKSSPTSPSLLLRAQAEDPSAWEQIVRLYSPLVFDWARGARLAPDDASDVMQNVFQLLATRLHQFRRRSESDSFRGWLYSITRNQIRDHFRALQNQARALGGTDAQEMWQALPEHPPDETTATGRSELLGLRQRALQQLSGHFPARAWQAFYRTVVQGDVPQDVADDLQISVWAVYKARSRVLSKLRTEFQDLLH